MERLEFKKSWYEAIKCLSKEIQIEVFMATLEYAFEGKDSTDILKPTARAIFILIKDEIDNNQLMQQL